MTLLELLKLKLKQSRKTTVTKGWAYGYKGLVGKSPADFFTVFKGRPVMLEAKTSRNLTSFPLHYGSSRAIPKHQVSYGEGLVRAGGIALILIRERSIETRSATQSPRLRPSISIQRRSRESLRSGNGLRSMPIRWTD